MTRKPFPKPEKPARKAGRPSRDWKALFDEWLMSGKSRIDFLREKGIDGRAGAAWSKTRLWEKAVEEAHDRTLATKAAVYSETKRIAKAIVSSAVALPPEFGKEAPGREAKNIRELASPSAWQVLQQWRGKQGLDDVKLADALRSQIKLVLQGSLVKREDAEGKTIFTTTLRPHEIKALTQASADIQRIQRLALGLSTENVGVDTPQPESHIEKNVTPEDQAPVPIFEVQMSRKGRFLTARPRRVS